jgi:hypothetical protein
VFEVGMNVVVLDAANLPCDVGDAGVVVDVRQSAKDFPIGVRIGDTTEWFQENEIEVVA